MLYGDVTENEKTEDNKFDDMMHGFNRLQDQLSAQQQQLSSVIKQVNALIDHRDKRESQLINNKKEFKSVQKAKQAMKSRSKSTYISAAGDENLKV